MDVKGQRISIIGAAKSGIASARILADLGAKVLLTDIQSREKLEPVLAAAQLPNSVEVETNGHTEKVLQADFIVLSPGVPADIPILLKAERLGIPIHSEIEIAYRLSRGKRLVVTGSNGKTTTTSLLAEFCRKSSVSNHRTRPGRVFLGGNIGIPMIEFAVQTCDEDVQVLEVSSFQLETISSFRPDIAIITNFYENHLDRYPSFDTYIHAKQRIAMNMRGTDALVLNSDQIEENHPISKNTSCQKAWFGWNLRGRNPGVTVRNDAFQWVDRHEKEHVLFPVSRVKLLGRHNLENIMAALCGALLHGIESRPMEEVVRGFPGVEHRLEWVRELCGVTYINDSKGTNCAASIIALNACKAPVVLIAGGRDKGTDLSAWVSAIREKAKGAVLLGEAKERFRAALEGIVPLKTGKTFEEGVGIASAWAKPGDTVLLSPACSSYDMFPNFEVRGKIFKELVLKLDSGGK